VCAGTHSQTAAKVCISKRLHRHHMARPVGYRSLEAANENLCVLSTQAQGLYIQSTPASSASGFFASLGPAPSAAPEARGDRRSVARAAKPGPGAAPEFPGGNPPPWMSMTSPMMRWIIELHSMCHPGRPGPHGLGHAGSPGLAAFHSAKSAGERLRSSTATRSPALHKGPKGHQWQRRRARPMILPRATQRQRTSCLKPTVRDL